MVEGRVQPRREDAGRTPACTGRALPWGRGALRLAQFWVLTTEGQVLQEMSLSR